MAMVVRANKQFDGIGGHISTYASAATLYEVAFHHFFRGRGESGYDGDQIYFQGHASPGIYARAFLEGRLTEVHLNNFRRELQAGPGLSSYPHPWLMPGFLGIPHRVDGPGPDHGHLPGPLQRVPARPRHQGHQPAEGVGVPGRRRMRRARIAGRHHAGGPRETANLIFVINCNLQRLDGPVRGNGKIIQELEALFRGAGWNVIKVIWGDDWDPLLEKDETGLLVKRMGECVDGEYQKYKAMPGAYIREHFFGKYPELLKLVEHYSDEKLERMRRGGHDPEKVYAAYQAAVESTDRPTVILAKTVKGYGLAGSAEARNVAHQKKKADEEELREFRSRFGIPIADEDLAATPFYKPADDSAGDAVLCTPAARRWAAPCPTGPPPAPTLAVPPLQEYGEFLGGSKGKEMSTTMGFVRLLDKLCRDPQLGKLVVPIVPDESRTFGMEGMFRKIGIYAHAGQLYEPVDSEQLMYYKEAQDGQILEEGITEAGSMSSFIAAGTAYCQHGINMIPFFIYYSMFGFQRIGDLIWAAADMRTKGFLIGGTAGRTTLNGEGLQHQDGHSLLNAMAFPTVRAYDPGLSPTRWP